MANMFELWDEWKQSQRYKDIKGGLLGYEKTNVTGLPITQMGTSGWFGHGGTPQWHGTKLKDVTAGGLKIAKEKTVGYPIGYDEGEVDPGLAAGVKAKYGTIQKILSTEDRVGGELTKTGIDLYNNIAKKYFSKYAIRDNNGDIVKRNGKIELTTEGKNAVNSAITQSGSDLPPQLGGSSTVAQAKAFTKQDAESLSKFAGVDINDVKKNWAKKGGFDGLMANPAFTLGLALMQSSSQGKRIGSGILDDFVKAAGLSEHYKDRLKSRRNIMGPVTDAQRAMVARGLPSNISSPGDIESVFWSAKDKNKLRGHEAALDTIYTNVMMRKTSEKDWDYSKGMQQISAAEFSKEYKKLVASGEIKVVEGATVVYLSTGTISDAGEKSVVDKSLKKTLQWLKKKHKDWFMVPEKAEGGPVEAGQPYLVGEKGPEVVVPNANATVVSNDDSQIMSMLLASNPQLQNVSRNRAESILRSRFPDYFA